MRESAQEIEAQAARWIVRIDRYGDRPSLRAEIEAWSAVDDRRRGALLQAEALWALHAADAASQDAVAARDRANDRVTENRERRRLLLGGAGVAATLVAGAAIPRWGNRYATAIGEIRRVPFADGSLAAINSASVIEVDLGKAKRSVRIERGEAWFQVAKDAHRPFLVNAGRARVQAIGTAFAVRRRDGGVDVLVTEGVVEAWNEGDSERRVRLAAGAHAFIAADARISEISQATSDLDHTLAWRRGEIDLAGRTLGEAVAEFNRYNVRKIVIVDPALEGQRLYGVFRTDDPEGFAATVQRTLGVPVDLRQPENITVG